jgi:mono/diheme cytochrome c family protein
VANDPVFHSAKSYKAIPLLDILEKYTKIKNLDITQTQIVFECEDGYNPSMDLSKVLSRKAFLAVADVDAPKGTDWTTIKKGTQEKIIAPFYVVYTNVTPEERDFKWPYNLVKISLVESAKEFAAVYPKDDDTMVKGYGLFQHNCMTCHALNKVGGKMGPELNYPKNITEYWRSTADIKAFIKNPASFRNDCKMPAINHLIDKELDEIVRYLGYMAKHKL